MASNFITKALSKNGVATQSLCTRRPCISCIIRLSSSIPDPKREHTDALRALRKGRKTKKKNTTDYRLRSNKSPSSSSLGNSKETLSKLWGSEIEAERERQKRNQQERIAPSVTRRHSSRDTTDESGNKKFISFFDEVDEKMERKRQGSLISLNKNKNVANEGKSSIDNLFDALHSKQMANNQNFESIQTLDKEELPTTIFEAFKQKKDNPSAFEKHDFEEYRNVIQGILKGEKFAMKHTKRPMDDEIVNPVIDYLLRDGRILPYSYPSLKDAAVQGISLENVVLENDKKKGKRMKISFRPEVSQKGSQSNIFHKEIQQQKDSFLELTKFDNVQYGLIQKAFFILASVCAKNSTNAPLSIAWEKIKESGLIPENQTLHAFLYVVGTVNAKGFLPSSLSRSFSRPARASSMSAVMSILGGSDSASINKEKEEGYDPTDYPTEMALFHDLLYTPTEKSVSLRVKKLVSIGDASSAQNLLDSLSSDEDGRLRTYLPIMKLYCEQGNVSSALKLFKRMREATNVLLEPENYVLLVSVLAENGYFRSNSDPVAGAKEIGYNSDCGPEFFDELLQEMSEDILEISSASARRLHNALAVGLEKEMWINTPQLIHSLGGVPMNNELAKPNDLIVNRISVGRTTALCPRSGVRLRLINLERKHRKQLHSSLLNLSEERFEEFVGNDQIDKSHAARKLNEFSNWLDTRNGKPFTAIIDGANIGYYMQNFDKGCFNFYQIQFLVDALESMGENPLVILPYKYLLNSFGIMNGTNYRAQHVSPNERNILNNLLDKGQLYRVPARCLDDFYWMLASVSDQTVSRNGIDIDVKPDSVDGKWPGARPMLISNDQMRDHKLGLLEPRLFRRWMSCYIVNYSFTAFVGKESADKEISFSTADIFSREIQCNQTNDGNAWHFPVRDWALDDRLCIRIPKKRT